MLQMKKTLLALAACALAAPAAWAAGYPDRPVRLVVPYAVGGATDVIGRVVARYLGEELGQSIVVENKPGAGGSTGSLYASKQPADGYTLVMMVESSHAVNPSVYAKPAYDPVKGMCCYFTSMRPGHYRIYASRDSSFWCCGHTGLESPAKLGKFIYSHKVTNRHQEKDIRVNLFIPSILSWKEEGVELIQQSRIPESEQVDLTLNLKKKQKLILRIRKPDWTDKATFIINGEEEQPLLGSDGYWIIDRVWERKNVITLRLPMHIYTENLTGTDRYVALLYGPYVLAGRMGKENLPTTFWGKMNNTAMNKMDMAKVPVFREPVERIPTHVEVVSGEPLKFGINLKGFEHIVLEPFYKVHFERYAVYWPITH